MVIITDHVIHNKVDDSETKVELRIHHTPFRKGDGLGAYSGPTPDDEEEAVLEEIFLDGESLASDHPFHNMITDDELLQLVSNYHESIAKGAYRGEL